MAAAPIGAPIRKIAPIVKKPKKPTGVDLGNLLGSAFDSLATVAPSQTLTQRYADIDRAAEDEDYGKVEMEFRATHTLTNVCDLSGIHYGIVEFEKSVVGGDVGAEAGERERVKERIGEALRSGVERYMAT